MSVYEVSPCLHQSATKQDISKPRMDLVPPEAMLAMGRVLTFGANKYAARNWENGMAWGRIVAALLRHLFAWLGGEDKDSESGFSHLDHVLTNAAFLVTYEARRIGEDDRGKVKRSDATLEPVTDQEQCPAFTFTSRDPLPSSNEGGM